MLTSAADDDSAGADEVSTHEAPQIRVLTRAAAEQVVYPLAKGTAGIGRSSENALVLQDSLVSRQHARIEFDGEVALIHDIGGKNPVRVNGEEVKGDRELFDGDRIAIGRTELLFEFAGSPSAPVRVVRDETTDFSPGLGAISLDAATVRLGLPEATGTQPADAVYHRLTKLYQLSEELLSATDEESVYESVLTAAIEETRAQRGFFGLVPQGETFDPYALNVVRFWDPENGKDARVLEMSESILHHIQRERRAVLVQDVPDQRDFGMSVIDLKIRSFICVPIAHGEAFLGLLYVDTRGGATQLGRSDLEFVSALGRMASMCLENLRVHVRLERENEKLRSLVGGGQEVIGSCDAIQAVFEVINKVAPRDASVLIGGENGTGKELVARAIHSRSARRDKPFVAVNCAAIPPHLVESELFGHVKGAFTGATDSTEGKFDLADGGTLFLDEIGDMPLDMQVKILRALQERCFYRVGGKDEIKVDIRVLAATNVDLQKSIEEGTFREDLFFRLAVVTIVVPPLRDRGDDILEIADHFLGAGATLTKPAKDCLLSYHWPGNVRELRNVLEQAVILGDGKRIAPSDLPPHVRKKGAGRMAFLLKPLSEVERQYIQRVLEETEGNKAKAATLLGISRETLYQKLKQYERDAEARGAGS